MDDHPADRDLFWSSLIAANSKVYFCGHDHFYDRLRANDSGTGWDDDDIYQMIVGSGGAPLYSGYAYNGANTAWTLANQSHVEQFGYAVVTVLNNIDVAVDFYGKKTDNTYAVVDSFEFALVSCCQESILRGVKFKCTPSIMAAGTG